MRGKSVKLINKFINVVRANSTEEERANKSKPQMLKEVKKLWQTNGNKGKEFIHKVAEGKL